MNAFNVTIRDSPALGLTLFTMAELNAIASSLNVQLSEGVRQVFFGENPPADTSLPWVKTLADGVTPVGGVQKFVAGKWRSQ